MANHNGWTRERKVAFLNHLSETGFVRHAAARVGLSAQSAYLLRRRDEAFARAWDAALVLAREEAEQVLAERAINGVVEPVFYRGEQVGERVKYDNRLLLAHLARLDRRCDAETERHAARFDEMLALIGGTLPEEEELRPVMVDPHLPRSRKNHVDAVICEVAGCDEDELDEAYDLANRQFNGWLKRAHARVDECLSEPCQLCQPAAQPPAHLPFSPISPKAPSHEHGTHSETLDRRDPGLCPGQEQGGGRPSADQAFGQ